MSAVGNVIARGQIVFSDYRVMALDLYTLLIIAVCTLAIAGGLLLVTWLQSPNQRALCLWATSFGCAALGVALITSRGIVPDIWSIVIGNAMVAASYGVMWMGARSFEGRSISIFPMLAGALVWLYEQHLRRRRIQRRVMVANSNGAGPCSGWVRMR